MILLLCVLWNLLKNFLLMREDEGSNSCKPWTRHEQTALLGGHSRSRADKAHFASQNIDQLRKLIQLCSAKNSAKAGNARIVGARHQRTAAVLPLFHGSIFVNDERPTI